MSRLKTQYLGQLLMVACLVAIFSAVQASLWFRVLANILCMVIAAWWMAAMRVERVRQVTCQAALAKQAREENEARNGLMAVAQSLLGTLEQCMTLAPPLAECGDLQRQVIEKAVSLLEDAALVQEDLVELTARISAFLDFEGPAIEKTAQELFSLAKVNEARLTEISGVLTCLLTDMGRQQQDLLAHQASLSATTETCLATFEAAQEAVSAGNTALTDWRRPFGNIGQAAQVATDLAEQARILGVNASIEALRSGEAGRGFMLVAEEAERISERMVRVTHQVAVQVEDGELAANKLVDALVQARSHLTRGGEAGSQLVNLVSGLAKPAQEIALAKDCDIPGLMRQITIGAGLLCDRLTESLHGFDPIVADEGKNAAARLFGEIERLVSTLKASEAKFGGLEEGLRDTEATVLAAVAAGREFVAAAAGPEKPS